MKYFLGICLLITTLISSALYSDAYDDCILKNMKGVTSDNAANAIVSACYNKHKKKDTSKNTEKKFYYKEVCTNHKANLSMGDGEWDDSYYSNFIVPVTNNSSGQAWVNFYYAKKGSSENKDFILAGRGIYISANSTGVLKISEDDIIYSDKGFTYMVKGTYESCKTVKTEYK